MAYTAKGAVKPRRGWFRGVARSYEGLLGGKGGHTGVVECFEDVHEAFVVNVL